MQIIRINSKDNVGVAVTQLKKGLRLKLEDSVIHVRENILPGHKVALRNLPAGSHVCKYGQIIGHTTGNVPAGSWLHSHNLKTNLAEKPKYTFRPAERKLKQGGSGITFKGYRRSNGTVGTRNEIWIISTVGCINGFAEKLAFQASRKIKLRNCDGIFAVTHPYGCSQLGADIAYTQRIIAGLVQHPNAGGVLVLGLGCENNQLKCQLGMLKHIPAKRLEFFNLQDVQDEMGAGMKAVAKLVRIAEKDRRVDCPASDLVVGVKCGGSDAFSGITANPLIGRISDTLAARNGTVLLSEVPEMFGAEQLLMNRARNRKVFRKIVDLIECFKRYFVSYGQPVYENPSPGNKAGGITTLEEKSLGAIQKGGVAEITQVLAYGEIVKEKGLSLLNAPGNDGVSSTAMTASGATLLLFATGRGTPMGFPVPTIKISSNSNLACRKPGWIDFDAGKLLSGATMDVLSDSLLKMMLAVASGKKRTRNEINGYREIAIWKDGVTL